MKIKISSLAPAVAGASAIAISGTADNIPPKARVGSEHTLFSQGDLRVSVSELKDMGTAANPEISFDEPLKTWGSKEVARFRTLAEKRAIGTIQPAEQAEFRLLQLARRQLESPRSTDDILADWRAHQLMRDLKSLFEKHVSFFGTKS